MKSASGPRIEQRRRRTQANTVVAGAVLFHQLRCVGSTKQAALHHRSADLGGISLAEGHSAFSAGSRVASPTSGSARHRFGAGIAQARDGGGSSLSSNRPQRLVRGTRGPARSFRPQLATAHELGVLDR